MQSETREFQAEVKQLLDLMVHSLYSNKDVFLRELISNSSDALDRLRFEQVTNPELRSSKDLSIRLEPKEADRTLAIIDNGIGMSRQEVIDHLGTIAKSGTKDFLGALKKGDPNTLAPELIGQFGVGFYASFMVADKVEVVTRRAGETTATRWVSEGAGSYTLEDAERDEFGTTITLHLKPVDEENSLRDYTSEYTLKDIVKRYSDFVAYPIKMQTWKDKGKAGTKVFEDETLNSMKAIWARSKDEVKPEEYKEFYKHIAHDWNEPLTHIPIKIEGTFEAQGILYLPSKAPFDLYHPEMKRGVQLYVKRVFIMDECKELLPTYLRFVKGVVDAQDLSLNVSREILQQSRQIQVIRKQLIKKVFDTLDTMAKDSPDQFDAFWAQFGPVLKEGLVNAPAAEKQRILAILKAKSTHDAAKETSLDAYIERSKPDQKAIYYLTGTAIETLRKSPHLEAFQAKGYEVLLFTDHVDELWLEQGAEYREKPFKSVSKGQADLTTEDEQKEAEKALEEKGQALKNLLAALRVRLQEDVKEVRLSSRLMTSPVCLVSDESDMTPQMERILQQLGQNAPKVKRILELNPNHAIVTKLQKVFEADEKSSIIDDYAQLLYGQAILAEGSELKDPVKFAQLVSDLMVRAV
ncbi:MAG: molecular chaperone HtpG [Deltaproteobacteria bacterium]|nr:molecular chaperone HtpG [Deltaproteobacteria bacterium]